MFIGHFGLGLGAKRYAPAVSLGTLFLAAQFADILWPSLLIAGVEKVEIDPGNMVLSPLNFVSYPYSHSLLALAVWSILFALAYRVLRGSRAVAIATVSLLVLSHWFLDLPMHRPDLPLTLSGPERFGFGLWNRPLIAIPLELLLFAVGIASYLRSTRARTTSGTVGLWLLIAFLVAAYFAALFGPPPPSVTALAWSAQSMWLLIAWGYWIDRQRQPAY
jgi:multidrug transporter EmrE-like cation transporter